MVGTIYGRYNTWGLNKAKKSAVDVKNKYKSSVVEIKHTDWFKEVLVHLLMTSTP